MSIEEQKAAKKVKNKSGSTPTKPREKKIEGTPKSPRSQTKRSKKVDDTPLFSGIKEDPVDYTADAPCLSPEVHRYIQVEKGNLLTYLAYGLIYPVNLEDRDIVRTESRARDPQSVFPDALVISAGFLQNAEEDQVLIEVTLSKEEENMLIATRAHSLLPKPLPVSRIAAVWTMNDKARSKLLASAKTFSDAPMRAELVNNAPEHLIAACPELDFAGAAVPCLHDELREQKKRFDQMLGMFAFMRNTEKYFSGRTNRYSDVSRGYIPTLAKLNPAIQTPLFSDEDQKAGDFYSGLLGGSQTDAFFAPVMEIVRKGGNFDRDAVEKILAAQKGKLTPGAATEVEHAFHELFDDGFKQCIQILEQVPSAWQYTILAILHRFHKRGSNDKQNIKNVFPEVISDSKRAEIILAILGQYYGYASLPKDETIDNVSPALLPIVGRQHPIKYDLRKALDRITIETVFQIAHRGTIEGGRFDYLPRFPVEQDGNPLVVDSKVKDESYTIEGTRICVFKVTNEVEQLGHLVRDTYRQGRKPFYLAMYAVRRYPQVVKAIHIREGLKLEIDIDFDGLLAALPKIARTDAAEIRACVEADKQYVYLLDRK